MNLSITSGIVPNQLKCAQVKTLSKKNIRTDVGNYRPVSILCIISKILEKAVYKQLESYLIKKNLLYEIQCCFKSAYSTDTCLIHLFDHIKYQSSKGLFTSMVIIDPQKAFHTVDHQKQAMRVSNIKWFLLYLTGRKRLDNINGSKSNFADIGCGISHGSNLDPLFFLYYVNDMSISINSVCKLILYADYKSRVYLSKTRKRTGIM